MKRPEALAFISDTLKIPIADLKDDTVIDPEVAEDLLDASSMALQKTLRIADTNRATVGEFVTQLCK